MIRIVIFFFVLIPQSLQTQASAQQFEILQREQSSVQWDRPPLEEDFDCDGNTDAAYLGRGNEKVYVAVFVSESNKPSILEFQISSAIQMAICAEPASLVIENLDYDPVDILGTEMDGFQRSSICKGLKLSGGECDSVHLFWNHKTNTLNWWRL